MGSAVKILHCACLGDSGRRLKTCSQISLKHQLGKRKVRLARRKAVENS